MPLPLSLFGTRLLTIGAADVAGGSSAGCGRRPRRTVPAVPVVVLVVVLVAETLNPKTSINPKPLVFGSGSAAL